MGSFVVYILEWSLCLSAFLLLYKMCFSGCTFHRFNRLFLLGSVVVSALLPLIHINMGEQMEPIAEVCRVNAANLEPFPVVSQLPLRVSEAQERLTVGQKVFVAIAITYLIYIVIQVIGWLRSLVKMQLFLRGKRTRRVGRWVRLVVHDEEYGPFSWMNYLVISDKETGFSRRASMHHELSHIVLMHPIDLVLLLLCTLINPICWFVMKEIKVVHEYEADDEVINHYHIKSRDYQRLLVLRTVGAEAYALACSFNLNIKKRIMMMKKKQSHWWRMMWIAVTIPLVGIALTAFSKPKEALKDVVDSSVRIIERPLVNALSSDVEEVAIIETPTPTMAEIVEDVVEDMAEVSPEVKPGDRITGRIKDEEGKPLKAVYIIQRDENNRVVSFTVSDMNGMFSFWPKLQFPLNISCPGYESQTLDIRDAEYDITLKRNAQRLKNVIKVSHVRSIDADDPHYQEKSFQQANDGTFMISEQMPVYPGGPEELYKYLCDRLRYPAVAVEMQVGAEIIVEFTIDKTGLVRSPKVVEVKPLLTDEIQNAISGDNEEANETMKACNDAIEAMKEEAIHLVRNMPRWEPGRSNGVRYAADMRLPITFKMAGS